VPTRDGVLAGAAKLAEQDAELPALMRAGLDAARAIEAALAARLPEKHRPDLKPLLLLMQCVAEAAGGAADAKNAAAAAAEAGPSIAEAAIESRDDAIRALGRICAWIERNEPASPAPIFIRRSQELLKKSFIEIIRDLLPDNVKQIEHFAGKGHS
jgi:type VI secretion system protein ImpA